MSPTLGTIVLNIGDIRPERSGQFIYANIQYYKPTTINFYSLAS